MNKTALGFPSATACCYCVLLQLRFTFSQFEEARQAGRQKAGSQVKSQMKQRECIFI